MIDCYAQCVILNGAKRSEGSGLRIGLACHSVARSFAALRMTDARRLQFFLIQMTREGS
jgi:hypothetical protein